MDETIEKDFTDFIEIFAILRKLYQENGKQKTLQKKIEYALACIIFWISNKNVYWSGYVSVDLMHRIRNKERISGSREHPNQRTRTAQRLLNDKNYESINEQDFLNEFKEIVCLWHLVTSEENRKLNPRSNNDHVSVKIIRISENERKLIQSKSIKPEKIANKIKLIDEILERIDQRENKILTNG